MHETVTGVQLLVQIVSGFTILWRHVSDKEFYNSAICLGSVQTTLLTTTFHTPKWNRSPVGATVHDKLFLALQIIPVTTKSADASFVISSSCVLAIKMIFCRHQHENSGARGRRHM